MELVSEDPVVPVELKNEYINQEHESKTKRTKMGTLNEALNFTIDL